MKLSTFVCSSYLQVMKMMMPLLSPASGTISFLLPEGSTLAAGDCIATLDLDDPSSVTKAAPFTGQLPELGPPQVESDRVDHVFAKAFDSAKMVMAGEGSLAGGCCHVSFTAIKSCIAHKGTEP